MDKLIELVMDMGRLWDAFWMQYLVGMRNTLILAVAATLIGCVIGFACGVLNTIPYTKQDNAVKRFFLKLVRVVVRVYVEVFRGTPMVLRRCSSSTACPISPIRPCSFGAIWACGRPR